MWKGRGGEDEKIVLMVYTQIFRTVLGESK